MSFKENEINKDKNFWQKYKLYIIVASCVCVVLCISFILLFNNTPQGLKPADIEISQDDESTIILNPTKNLNEYSNNENLYIVAGKLKQTEYYQTTVKGKITAMGGLYTQTVNNLKIKRGEDFYSQTKSTSTFVSVGKQALFNGDNVVYRDATDVNKNKWSNNILKVSKADFKQEFGVLPMSLSNYELNDQTILSSTRVNNADGTITISYKIDVEKGTKGYRVNMYVFGGLTELPKLNSCTLEITIDANWQLKSVKSSDSYTINKGGILTNLACTSSLTETYEYPQASNIEIPNYDLFTSKIEST